MTAASIPITEGRAGVQQTPPHTLAHGSGAGLLPAPVTLTIPTPPSVNQLFRNLPGRGRVRTRIYDDWRGHALTAIRLQSIEPVMGPVVILFGVERQSSAADIDNRIKAMLDAIVEAQVIRDDSEVTGFAAAWLPPANGLAHVQIFPTQAIGIEFHPSPDGATGGWFAAPQQDGEPDGDLD